MQPSQVLHTPLTQVLPAPHLAHAAPPMPQRWMTLPGAHVSPSMQPPHAAHCPATQSSSFLHTSHAPPPVPQA